MKKVFLFFLFITCSSFAQEMPVPIKLQAALFKKVFEYDLQLNKPSIIILYNSSTTGIKEELITAFKDAGLTASALREEQLGGALSENTVIYSTPGVIPPKQLSIKYKSLSISGVPGYVEKGLVSVGLGLENGKPKILVNLKQLKAEGHELSAYLLKIANVIN